MNTKKDTDSIESCSDVDIAMFEFDLTFSKCPICGSYPDNDGQIVHSEKPLN